jgi:hypothetical protein
MAKKFGEPPQISLFPANRKLWAIARIPSKCRLPPPEKGPASKRA